MTDGRSLENDRLRLEIDDQGLISSIFDKTAERQVMAPGRRGNLFQLHPDYPNFFDAWDIDRFAFDQVIDINEVASIEAVDTGPLRAGIRVVREFGRLPSDPDHPARRRITVCRFRDGGAVARVQPSPEGGFPR